MDDWIKPLAEKERIRVAAIKSFRAAVPAFMKLLLTTIQADLSQFEQEFPREEVKAFFLHGYSESISVTRSFAHSNSSASIGTSPERRVIQCSYEHCPNSQKWEMPLELSDLGIHFPGRSIEPTVAELSRNILKPILFPDL
ncbi:MAG: hypothetical protein HYX72_10435 [Acidobacteria bacterium]|nr:hypothetical protein [Acidobacteriota bacterium]